MSLKQWMADAACRPTVGRAVGRIFSERIPCRGHRVWTGDPAVHPRTKASLLWGIYEAAELRFVRTNMRRDLDVVELGASLGVVTAEIARRIDPRRQLLAVEADPRLIPSLTVNSAGRATVIHAAVTAPGTSEAHLRRSTTTIDGRLIGASAPDAIKVPATSLDNLLTDHGVGAYVLVADVEGSEVSFIDTDPAGPLGKCQQAILELHATEDRDGHWTVEELLDVLVRRHGFTASARRGAVVVVDRT